MLDEGEEQYDLVEIYSLDKIAQKRARFCTCCGKTVACCVWKSVLYNSRWKYCLDCQSDHFPEWPSEWDSLLNATKTTLSRYEVNEIIKRCSKELHFEMPTFPLQQTAKKSDQQMILGTMNPKVPRNQRLKANQWCQCQQ